MKGVLVIAGDEASNKGGNITFACLRTSIIALEVGLDMPFPKPSLMCRHY